MSYRTFFTPKNRPKYVGDAENIVCRSLWERKFCKYLDENISIVRWGFEQIKIPYVSVDNKIHMYISDFVIKKKNKANDREITIIEIKPKKQTSEPTMRKNKKAFLRECVTYSINTAKWKSAQEYCATKGWTFKIITELELF